MDTLTDWLIALPSARLPDMVIWPAGLTDTVARPNPPGFDKMRV